MSDFSIKELEQWNKRIENTALEMGLNFYEQEFEIVSYEDMIAYEAYVGMPSHYPHWSYGKAYERLKTLNKYNLSGLPYEMVINSNPCIAYLMKDNTLLLQILTMAHVYGHNDFFKNNRLFKTGTRAEYAIQMFKNQAGRVRDYIDNPGIGYNRVEKIINAAHALKFQMTRVVGEKKLTDDERRKELIKKQQKVMSKYSLLDAKPIEIEPAVDLKKIPLEPEDDLLLFISTHGKLEEWEKDIINIVREEIQYFLPQISTKIMNEGWASFCHYTILNKLELPQGLHMEFLKRHNQVIKPDRKGINPYYLGFKIFEYLKNNYPDNPNKIFEIREIERDESFIRRYLTYELCSEINLFEYIKKGKDYVVSEIPDEKGWEEIRNTLALSVGMGGIPVIKVIEWDQKDNTLILWHEYDGRELEFDYASETLKHLLNLWDGRIVLETFMENKRKVIVCDDKKNISIRND